MSTYSPKAPSTIARSILGYAFNEGEAGYQQSFISGYRRDYVNGQFSLADLAPAWQQKLSASLPKPAAGTR